MIITENRMAFAVAALIVSSGVVAVELANDPAQSMSLNGLGTPAYASARIDAVFEVVAEMPQVAEVRVPMAKKGDLPIPQGCIGLANNAQAECVDMAYKVLTEPSFVVATSFGNTTTLMRMDAIAVADVFEKVFWHSGQRENMVSE